MPKTLEERLADGIANSERITDWNTRYINGEVNSGDPGYDTAEGCGTKAIGFVFMVGATLAAWGWVLT